MDVARSRLLAALLVGFATTSACAGTADERESRRDAPPTPSLDSQPAAALPASSVADTSLDAFWTRFRDAVAREDTAELVRLTDRGFQTRGEADDDPWIPRDSTAVVALLDSLLGADPGLGRESSMRALIAATPKIDAAKREEAGVLRLGILVFEVRGATWRLAKAFLP